MDERLEELDRVLNSRANRINSLEDEVSILKKDIETVKEALTIARKEALMYKDKWNNFVKQIGDELENGKQEDD